MRAVGTRAGGRYRARTLAKAAVLLLRAYTGFGGPVLAVALFLTTGRAWWALGSLLPWFAIAKLMRRVTRGG